ncbi:unnamed protein product [Miscanthus lutarioriparius]|uniref:RING-type E3 ubiquitin transferase n=1 Tax=Miscanthus lutarioriparius TaxID=422564 RepID=A0A811PP31_9POAL|nr:unnamed protein product [Miscanthus lutarioriparius]
MDAPTTSSSTSSPFPGTSFVILSVSIVGILATSLLLLAYYLFLTRCGLLFFWRPGGTHDDDDVLAGPYHRHRRVVVTVHEPGPPRRSGLEEAAIRRIPTFRYRHGHLVLAVAEAKQAGAECAVCLADFRDGERLRVLPPCLHAFHIDCIDAWLQSAASCPLCRAAVSDPAALSYCHHLDIPVPVPVPRATTDDIAIDVISTTISPSAVADEPAAVPADETAHRNSSCRSCSMGGGAGGGDGCFLPMRRSLSMDSSTDKRFYLALQSILRQSSGGSPAVKEDEEGKAESSNAAADTGPPSSRRLRRSFFSFSQSRGSRSAVLPL